MRRFLSLFFLMLSSVAGAQFRSARYEDIYDSDNCRSFKEQIEYLSSASLEGRKAGSEGEAEAAAYIARVMSSMGVDVLSPESGDLFGIRQPSGDTLTSRNVIGFIQGSDRNLSDRYIVIGARLDNLGVSYLERDGERVEKIFFGANGNASGLSMMLHLAEMLSTNRMLLNRSVILAAFGSSLEGGAGAWYFLNRSFPAPEKIDAMINLDMLGTGAGGFYAYTASNEDMGNIVRNLSNTLQPVHPRLVSMEPVNSDHRIFYDKEIPSIFFTSGMYREYNTERDTPSIIEYDYMERELEYIYNYSVALINGAKPQFRPESQPRRSGEASSSAVPYAECDIPPVFLGSADPLNFMKKWVYVYLRYPESCIAEGVQGKVLVGFIINEKGKVTDVKVLRGVDERLDEEAVRVVSASPDWRAARKNGQKVRCEMSVYVDFKLERKR